MAIGAAPEADRGAMMSQLSDGCLPCLMAAGDDGMMRCFPAGEDYGYGEQGGNCTVSPVNVMVGVATNLTLTYSVPVDYGDFYVMNSTGHEVTEMKEARGASRPGTVMPMREPYTFTKPGFYSIVGDRDAADAPVCELFVLDLSAGVAPPLPPASVVASLTLNLDISTIPEGSEARATFEAAFQVDMGTMLGISASRIRIVSIVSGSIIVTFAVDPATDGTVFDDAVLSEKFSVPGVSLASTVTATVVTVATDAAAMPGCTASPATLEAGVATNLTLTYDAAVSFGDWIVQDANGDQVNVLKPDGEETDEMKEAHGTVRPGTVMPMREAYAFPGAGVYSIIGKGSDGNGVACEVTVVGGDGQGNDGAGEAGGAAGGVWYCYSCDCQDVRDAKYVQGECLEGNETGTGLVTGLPCPPKRCGGNYNGIASGEASNGTLSGQPVTTSCGACSPGEGPDSSDQCKPCTGLKYSSVGVCQECDAPNIVNNDHTQCTRCQPGEAPNAARTECVACQGATFSSFGVECQDCMPPNVVVLNAGSRSQCSACRPGLGPSADGSECVDCTRATYSTIGVCQECDMPNIVDAEHKTCTRCLPGQQPNTDQSDCEICPLGRFSALGGGCQTCESPNVVNGGKTACASCPPGDGPVETLSGIICADCAEGKFSPGGVCLTCAPPNVPVMDATQCSATKCPAGTTCPLADDSCETEAQCEDCPPGQVSLGGSCTSCSESGKYANPDQSACGQCLAGTEPNADRSACSACEGDTFSQFGIECQACEFPNTVNEGHTLCSVCSAGKGPDSATQSASDDDKRICEACVETKYSTTGVCQECDAPNIVNNDHTQCTRCQPGEAPNAARTECVACQGATFSSFGFECQDCVPPNVVVLNAGSRTQCSACRPGLGPSADGSECVECAPSCTVLAGVGDSCVPTYSTIGVCLECLAPSTVNNARTACNPPFRCPPGSSCPEGELCDEREECDTCAPGNTSLGFEPCRPCTGRGEAANPTKSMCITCTIGQQPRHDRTACEQCAGNEYSTYGVSCDACPLGFTPDEQNVVCNDMDECNRNNGGCDRLATVAGKSCTNTAGAYRCGDCPIGLKKEESFDLEGRMNGPINLFQTVNCGNYVLNCNLSTIYKGWLCTVAGG